MATDTSSTTAEKSTTKQRPAKKGTTKKAAAKKSTTRKNTAGASKNPAGATTASTSATTRTPATSAPVPLQEREPRMVLEDAGYAVTGVLGDVVDGARHLPTRIEQLWSGMQRTAKDAPKRARSLGAEAPARLDAQLTDLRGRVSRDTGRLVASLEKQLDGKAGDGREVADRLRRDDRVATILERTSVSRSQVKAAVTSATRTADAAIEGARRQLDVARFQAKGAVTSVSRTPDAARSASREQATNARTRTKAAVTSVRKSADEVADTVGRN